MGANAPAFLTSDCVSLMKGTMGLKIKSAFRMA